MSLDRVTCAEVESATFGAAWIRRGYDETAVDLLLDRCADTIAAAVRAHDEIVTVCRDAARRGKTVGERALALTVLGILSDNHADAAVEVSA